MFSSLGTFAVRHPKPILLASGVFVAMSIALGVTVFGQLSSGGFADPQSESERANAELAERFGTGVPNIIFIVDAIDLPGDPGGAEPVDAPFVDDPAVEAAVAELSDELAGRDDVTEVFSYWSLGNVAPLRSDAGDAAVLLVRTTGTDAGAEPPEVKDVIDAAVGDHGTIRVSAAGSGPVFHAIADSIKTDLALAEAIAIPLMLLLLVVVFGSLVAAGLPLVIAGISVTGTLFSLWVIAQITDVSIFSVNLATALGLGLAVDYSLFIVSRFREELAGGLEPGDAVVRTVETAGRTVAVSGLTVAVSLSALLVFPLYFLRSFAYAGMAVTLVSLVASLLTLPALLALTGRRIDSLPLLKGRGAVRPATDRELSEGFWHRTATFVMRHPVAIASVIVVILLLLGAPFLRVEFGLPDERALPPDDPVRIETERLTREFSSNEGAGFAVISTAADTSDTAIDATAAELSARGDVGRVDAATGRYIDGTLVLGPDASLEGFRKDGAARFHVVPTVPMISEESQSLVSEIRDTDLAVGEVIVAGRSASLVDTKATIAHRLPWAIGFIAVATFVLLFAMFGSLLVPIKAIVLNLLSLSATFGAMVWVFQDGNLSGLLGFTPTGLTDITTPILMFCVVFGLSMDYEVFLLSRIREEYERTGDNDASVAAGLEKTGHIVTAAAGLLAITFIALASSGIAFIKLMGIGLALAVVMDASMVRIGLVPAFMRLAGNANWWAPGFMRGLHRRFGLSASEESRELDSEHMGETPSTG